MPYHASITRYFGQDLTLLTHEYLFQMFHGTNQTLAQNSTQSISVSFCKEHITSITTSLLKQALEREVKTPNLVFVSFLGLRNHSR
jgi:hypothetical protein